MGAVILPSPDGLSLPPRAGRAVDLLCEVPVPLRMRVADDIAQLRARHFAATGTLLETLVPLGQGGASPLDRLRHARTPEDFPRMLVSARHGNAFNRRFHANHVEKGAFSACQPRGVAPVFADAGLVDPEGWIGIYAVAPFVMLVDHTRLGSRPAPQRWSDLAEPDYRGEVVFGGWRRPGAARHAALNTFFLLMMLRLLGPAGLRRLLSNVPDLVHSAEMPRLAGTGRSPAAVYVLPWSLAGICPRRQRTRVVWPQDGALAYPLWTTVQAAHRQRLGLLVDYLFAPATAAFLERNGYPALAPGHLPRLPEAGRLLWPGWDYVRHRAAADDLRTVLAAFRESRGDAEREMRRCA